MANDFGFDFRNTIVYATDPSYATYVIANGTDPETNYPTTRTVNGVSITFGWETNAATTSCRDRDNTLDPRLAGVNFPSSGNTTLNSVFRVDLPSTGNWMIGLALGDVNPQTNYAVVSDTSTALITFSPISTGASQSADAAGNVWSDAAWPGSNVTVTKTFTTTICRVTMGGTTDTNNSCIRHLRLTQSGSHTKSLSDTLSITETFIKSTTRTFVEAITLAETFKRATGVLFTESFSLLEGFFKATTRSLSEVFTITDVFSKFRGKSLTLSDVFTVTDGLGRSIGKLWKDVVTLIETFTHTGGSQGPPVYIDPNLLYYRNYMYDMSAAPSFTAAPAPADSSVAADENVPYWRQYLGGS